MTGAGDAAVDPAALAARPSPRDGGAAGEVERLTRERDEARASNRKLHRDIQQRGRDFVRSTRAEQRRVWLYLGHPKSLSAHTWARREFAKQIDEAEARATAAESRAEAAERRLGEAVGVLTPFARYAAQHPYLDGAEGEIGEFYGPAFRVSISYAALRAARDFAAQLGATARKGGATTGKSPVVRDGRAALARGDAGRAGEGGADAQ